jgi:hypothetical protein
MFSEESTVNEPILVHLACSGIEKIQAGYDSKHTSLNREDMLNFVSGWKWISGLMTDLNPSDTCNTSMDIFEYVCNYEFNPDTNPSDRTWLAQKHKIEEFAILIMSIMYKRNCIDQFLFRSIIKLLSWNINYQNLNQNNSDHEISNKTWNKLLLQILNITDANARDGQTTTSNCVNVRDGQTTTSNCVNVRDRQVKESICVNVRDRQVKESICHTKINANISYNQSETTIYHEETENSIKTEKMENCIGLDIGNINRSKDTRNINESKEMKNFIRSKEMEDSIGYKEMEDSIGSKEMKNSIWSKECKLVSLSEDIENIIFQNSINYILVIILNNNKIKSRMNKITKILSQNLVSIGSLIPLTYDSLILKQEYEEYEEYNRLTQEMKKYDMIIPSNNTNFERITPEIISSKLDIMKKTNILTKQKIIDIGIKLKNLNIKLKKKKKNVVKEIYELQQQHLTTIVQMTIEEDFIEYYTKILHEFQNVLNN